ncbi:MAG: hypothetical protein J7L44_01055 [Candidatus Diapherotrites archaeon]|nr:hypothetical protein [Candidatus Diapherotrites archaeon]
MRVPGKKKRSMLNALVAIPETFIFRRRISRMPKRSEGRLLYGLWQYIEPKEYGFKKLPRTSATRKARTVHLLRKYIPSDMVKKELSLPYGGFELTVGVSFYKKGKETIADVFVVPKPYLSAERGFIKPKDTTSSVQRTVFELEQKNLERAVKMLAEKLGLKESNRLKVNFLYP